MQPACAEALLAVCSGRPGHLPTALTCTNVPIADLDHWLQIRHTWLGPVGYTTGLCRPEALLQRPLAMLMAAVVAS
jgi:hypothetical protein